MTNKIEERRKLYRFWGCIVMLTLVIGGCVVGAVGMSIFINLFGSL